MVNACMLEDEVRAVPFSAFAQNVFGVSDLAQPAARGLLYARGTADLNGVSATLPSFRVHWFFRNVEGLWACTSEPVRASRGPR